MEGRADHGQWYLQRNESGIQRIIVHVHSKWRTWPAMGSCCSFWAPLGDNDKGSWPQGEQPNKNGVSPNAMGPLEHLADPADRQYRPALSGGLLGGQAVRGFVSVEAGSLAAGRACASIIRFEVYDMMALMGDLIEQMMMANMQECWGLRLDLALQLLTPG